MLHIHTEIDFVSNKKVKGQHVNQGTVKDQSFFIAWGEERRGEGGRGGSNFEGDHMIFQGEGRGNQQ